MSQAVPVESLQTFQEKVFARHVLFDLPFPIAPTFLLLGLIGWVLYGKVSDAWLLLWAGWAIAAVLARMVFDRRMRKRVNAEHGYAIALRGGAALSLPLGLVSGFFAWLYFDVNEPTTMAILSTYMTVIIVGSVAPTSVYLPTFYLLVLGAYGPYLLKLLQDGRAGHWVVLGLNLLFLMVTFRYAHAAHRMHREAVRLRYEKQQLIEDLSERRAAAEHASSTKSLFLAGVSHDLKQPIRALGLYLGVLEHTQRQERADVVDKVAPKMQMALGELHGQVTRLLELSRLESGALEVTMVRVDLDSLFAGLHALFEAQAAGKGIRLRFANLERLRSRALWVDLQMLESILQNLISNAIKHTAVGTVYIGVRQRKAYRRGRQLCIEVRDTGSGIALEQQSYLFDAYRSFDDRKASESHGLGLAIAKAQATYLGASIAVRSAPGRGSVFTVCGLSTHNGKLEQAQDQSALRS
ncbi:sensor histidine kinase [Roseateles albus]|uniref:histidine kinase n=1 Tax=Roseateles albus TaxID=2987525 RepID=A0ABT5KBZ3_9BURK|nr:HAMP domain-containing sensor histidine kinase [Roseateles albus]MDC8770281.1 HAMP domain-containing sensor histidine kinase [Roseateles albus]